VRNVLLEFAQPTDEEYVFNCNRDEVIKSLIVSVVEAIFFNLSFARQAKIYKDCAVQREHTRCNLQENIFNTYLSRGFTETALNQIETTIESYLISLVPEIDNYPFVQLVDYTYLVQGFIMVLDVRQDDATQYNDIPYFDSF
jgi:hypothetical protein